MKSRFTTIDIASVITEIQAKFLGMRVANVYDVDNKTYLIKLQKTDTKAMLLLESGIRIHSTEFQWPKNMMPSGFSMKLRKHLRTRRLESIQQLGVDRIVDLQFGSNEAAYHVILELYDRGNMVLTDYEYTILNILRTRTDDSQDVRFAVREKYPLELARQSEGVIKQERLMAILMNAKTGDNLKKVLNPHLEYGPAIIDHVLLSSGIITNACIGKDFVIAEDMAKLMAAMVAAGEILLKAQNEPSKGYIIQKKEKKAAIGEDKQPEELLTYHEFHPHLYKQHEKLPYIELESFNKAVDEFFSKIGSQKLDVKMMQQEKAALKKLDNVKKDHEKRIASLQTEQDRDKLKAQLIEINLTLVDRAIVIVNTALANQIDWQDIEGLVKEAQAQGDFVASTIKSLKLDTNHITLLLKDPYMDQLDEDDDEDSYIKPMKVDIDLALSAYANARKYYDMKRHAVKKEQKTIEASGKALKSAERKTKEHLKEMQTVATINKARKTYWFEKFLWFITSENYLVIGGRDQQQNELIVKKYMKPGDLYVHADLHGASSCVLKNPSGETIPPKTLNEAGTMALCNSAAWDARVVTSAWWVYHHQVSKTAPTGEYLTTGSFMIRGKKNYLPPSYLVYGFGFLFKLEETSIFRHKDERRVKTFEEDAESVADSTNESDITDDNTGDEDEHDADSDSDETSEGEKTNLGENKDSLLTEQFEARVSPSLSGDEDCIIENVTTIKTENNVQDNFAKNGVEVKEEGDSDEDDALFPDTTLALQHVKGGKFRLQRGDRSISGSSHTSYDDIPVDEVEDKTDSQSVQKIGRLSAKQRRELKKQKKQNSSNTAQNENAEIECSTSDNVENAGINAEEPKQKSNKEKKVEPQAPPPKRGQKAKQKKIKDKYADQDEEEKQLRLELLGSAGAPKEDKKKTKKKNKQKEAQRQQKEAAAAKANIPGSSKVRPSGPQGRVTLEDIKVDTLSIEDEATIAVVPIATKDVSNQDEGADSDEEKQAILEEENIHLTQDADILDALTGQPVPEDILMFAIPVCAPYSCLVNYKYKVKLLPGTTKRGKAAKTAVHMFQQDKNTTPREKDVFKSLKDVDLSRNMPGKVKVSAPNLQKAKKGR